MNMEQIRFCAKECTRQKAGPMAVFNMCKAVFVAETQTLLTKQFILDLGMLVDPRIPPNVFQHIGE